MSTKPINVTDSNFEELVNQQALSLIDCWAPWCAPCRMIAPIIEDLAANYSEKVLVGKLNVDENPKTAERFQILSIPTLLIMKKEKEIERIVGLVTRKKIEARLEKYLET